MRCTSSKFPFQFITPMVLIYTVYNVCLCMNAFPLQSGITGLLSPRELVTVLTVNFTNHCTVDVGEYIEASTDVIITNGNNDRTHAYIALGPSRNRQGYINCFDLDTGKVVVRSTVKHIIFLESLIRKANTWGGKGKKVILKGQINFLNQRGGGGVDWENEDLTLIDMDDKEPKLVQPNFIAEIPGIEVKSDYEPIIGPNPNTEPEVKSSYAECANNARKNVGRKTDIVTQSKTRGVDDDEYDASVIEIEESDEESDGEVYPEIKQEAIKVEDLPENDEDNPPSLAEQDSVPPWRA